VLPVRVDRAGKRPVGLAEDDLAAGVPAQVAGTGASHLMVPVRARAATGTAAGPLAALLVRSGAAAEGTVVIEQGRALGRPSRIQVSVTGDQVTVSGSGLVVADGTILLE
jgi:predicted PhzF superfamily epimerase YddE/YHI9